ncbi:MAG: hypothetical protein MUE41_18375, partial [Gemmatimonadaceae bacterium]|nr:hypothetical protein [Gemmatimonadaceae bacterium]
MLLVSAAFPPHAIVGATRWEQFSARLVRDGWGVDVVCEQDLRNTALDWSRARALPPGIRVYGMQPGEPAVQRAYISIRRATTRDHALRGATMEVNSAHAAPSRGADIRARYLGWLAQARGTRWVRAAIETAAHCVADAPQLVVSSGPPHVAHLAGRAIARTRGVPHVIDMRDPWASDLSR